MIKAVFFDVDGMLVSHKSKSVPKSSRMAAEKHSGQFIENDFSM